jgi:hypothetical protein
MIIPVGFPLWFIPPLSLTFEEALAVWKEHYRTNGMIDDQSVLKANSTYCYQYFLFCFLLFRFFSS